MLRFLAGFLAASVLWGGFVLAYSRGLININLEPEGRAEAREDEPDDDGPASDTSGAAKKKRGARARRGASSTSGAARKDTRRYTGEATTGDDLGGPETRNLDPTHAGGEEQLTGREIEQGFDSVFPQIKRCLMLAAGDEPVTGKIVFGMRIAGQGGVARVNLQGPSAITQSEAGGCLRKAAQGIRFRSFNGPDMLVHYPVTLQ